MARSRNRELCSTGHLASDAIVNAIQHPTCASLKCALSALSGRPTDLNFRVIGCFGRRWPDINHTSTQRFFNMALLAYDAALSSITGDKRAVAVDGTQLHKMNSRLAADFSAAMGKVDVAVGISAWE